MEKNGGGEAGRLPVSVFLITRDEALRLPRTLAAVGWADDVVVVDSGSTDGTVAIAEAAGARVIRRDWDGYGRQKAFAEAACRHDWVLNLDADETPTPGLEAEVARIVGAGRPGAWRLRILNVYPGADRPRPFAADYNEVRLYHRSVASYRTHPLFDRVEVVAGVRPRQLRAPVHHHHFVDWAHLVDKENRYTTYVAAAARPRGRAALLLRLVVEAPAVFLKFWLLKGHVLGGWKGLAFSQAVAFARLLRVVKLLAAAEAGRTDGRGGARGARRENDG